MRVKLSQLLRPRKPKKQKKPDPLFFGWYGLGYAISPAEGSGSGSDVGMSEAVEETDEPSALNNFGFRPEMRQFWFRIADRPLFFDRQHEWEIEDGRIRTTFPSSSFIRYLLQRHIMMSKADLHYDLAGLLRYGELSSKGKDGAPMVFMFNPKRGVPNTKKMKEFGLKPVFMEEPGAN